MCWSFVAVSLAMEPTTDPALSYPSPTDLRFSELGSKEVKLHWTNPDKPVKQYRVVYHSAEGSSPQEVRIFSSRKYLTHEVIKTEQNFWHNFTYC